MNLRDLVQEVRVELDAKNKAREEALKLSRATIRNCALSIRAIHRKEQGETLGFIEEAKHSVIQAQSILKDYPNIYFAGFLQDAEKEYVEAVTTLALVNNQRLPKPDELGVGIPSYILGLGEAVGEVRRYILDLIREDKVDQGEVLLSAMDEIYYFMLSFDYPDAITPGLKRATDVAKSIMERTRGDLTNAIRDSVLRKELLKTEEVIKEKI